MKKLIIGSFLLLLTAAVHAQVFTLGPKIGVNYSYLKFDQTNASYTFQSLNRAPGVVVGGFVQLNLGPLNLQPEVLYSQERSKLSVYHDDEYTDAHIEITKVDVPLLAGLNFGRAFKIQGGPVMSRMLSASIDRNIDDLDIEQLEMRRWGYALGIGLVFGRAGLDLRYEGSLAKRDVNMTAGGQTHTLDYGRQNLQTTLAYRLIK